MDRRVNPPRQVTSTTWGPPPPCKQALKNSFFFNSKNSVTEFVPSKRSAFHFTKPFLTV